MYALPVRRLPEGGDVSAIDFSKCEHCRERPPAAMWNPENLGGHEILVCRECFAQLSREWDEYEAAEYARYIAQYPYDGGAS